MKVIKSGTWLRSRGGPKEAYRVVKTRSKDSKGNILFRLCWEVAGLENPSKPGKPYVLRSTHRWTLPELEQDFRVLKNKPPRKSRQHSLKI